MITYTWTIEAADCIVSQNGLDTIIQTVYWRYRGEDENGIVYEPSGAQVIGPANPDSFTPFEQINSQVVIQWLEALIDVSTIQTEIENKIQELNNPVIIRMRIPE